MKQHERDYFVSRIRSGKYRIQIFKKELEILSPTIEDEYYINKAYMDGMESSLYEGFKTNEEMVSWMVEKNLWSYNEDADLKMYQQKVKDLKIDIYNARNSIKLRERVRSEIRNTEFQVSKLNQKKSAYYNNTCEGIATVEKISEFLKRCTFFKGELYDFEELPVDLVSSKYYSLFLTERQIRDLARNEPWRTIWNLNDTNSVLLFNNGDRELSHDQKNIMVWSKMYDNVQESMDCPQDDIIKDDDMLDGWFLVQGKKRDEERSKSEVDNLNPKVAGSQEVYLMANSKEDRRRIDSLNSFESSVIKKQREQVIKSKGSASQLDFPDEKLKAQRMQTEGMRNQFRR
jgi:hypothetical protein